MKLLFLPSDLVDYVLLHELCHTVRMDHSAAFWALMAEHDPDCRAKRRLIKHADRHVPPWFGLDRPSHTRYHRAAFKRVP